MKKLTFVILLLNSCLNLLAQSLMNDSSEPVSIGMNRYEQVGDSVHLVLDLQFNRRMRGWESFLLSPVLQSGDQIVCLDRGSWLGRRKFLSLQRHGFLPEKNTWSRSKAGAKVRYATCFPYHAWMKGLPLSLRLELLDCCKTDPVWTKRLTTQAMKMDFIPVPDPYKMRTKVSFVRPHATPVKNRSNTGSAFLEFKQGSSELLPDYANNSREIERIRSRIDTLMLDKEADITSIIVKGFASLEGSSALNLKLSGSRAEALKRYLTSHYSIDTQLIRSESGGEDWEGLRNEIQATDFSWKDTVLKIIDSTLSLDAKDASLRQLDKGRLYQTISINYFPRLRRVDYTLSYTVKAFTVEEGKEVLKVSPDKLSLNELFTIANTYPVGSVDYHKIFDVAVRLFPNDPVARINAAAIALGKGDIASAEKYLLGLDKDVRAFNNYAVLLISQEDLEEATKYLLQARSAGVEEAEWNLQELEKYTNRERLIRNAMLNRGGNNNK